MDALEKVNESKYFLDEMRSNVANREKFLFNCSAFLTASRSALQYVLEELEYKRRPWFESYMTNSDILKYFRDKRNDNIHANPVKARRHTSVVLPPASITPTASLSAVIIRNINGEQVREVRILKKARTDQPVQPDKQEANISYRYKFSDWKGTENVIELSGKYLGEIEALIQDGISRGYLKP